MAFDDHLLFQAVKLIIVLREHHLPGVFLDDFAHFAVLLLDVGRFLRLRFALKYAGARRFVVLDDVVFHRQRTHSVPPTLRDRIRIVFKYEVHIGVIIRFPGFRIDHGLGDRRVVDLVYSVLVQPAAIFVRHIDGVGDRFVSEIGQSRLAVLDIPNQALRS